MDYGYSEPEASVTDVRERAPIDLAQREWHTHPLLKRASVNSSGDRLEWPGSTNEQRAELQDISLWTYEGELFARIGSEINFDLFAESSDDVVLPALNSFPYLDKRRFYIRLTNGGFHVVGAYSAVTIDRRRRYFVWLAGGWAEIGLSGFLFVRDDEETEFSEISPEEFERLFPASSDVTPESQDVREPQSSRHRRDSDIHLVMESDGSLERDAATDRPLSMPTAPVVPHGAIQRSIAIALATISLRGRTDRMGSALIDHAARVSESFDVISDNVRHCAAWLHDVLECSDLTDKDLSDAGLTAEIIDVVRLLTHDAGRTEEEWLQAISSDPDARAVKLAAITDNASPWRLRYLDKETQAEILETLARWREGLSADSTR